MSTSFSWGFPEHQGLQQGGVGVDPDVVVREALRANSTTTSLPPQSASPTAQNAAGLGIQNVRRGFLDLRVRYDSTVVGIDFQTSSTSFSDVSTELTGQMVSSGRPVLVFLRGTSTGDPCTFTLRIDSREVTGIASGVGSSATGGGIWIATPTAGNHTYAMQWKVASGTAILPRSYRPALTVVEL